MLPGTIWLQLLLGSFPWCLGLLALPLRRWRGLRDWALAEDARGLYWLLWALWPVAFFTPARNIIATYPMPALPALALLLTELSLQSPALGSRRFLPSHTALAALTVLIVGWGIVVSLFFPAHAPKQSERALVGRFGREQKPGDHLIYYGPRKYSAEFYSEGAVDHTTSAAVVAERLDAPGRTFVAIPAYWLPLVPPPLRRRLLPVATWGPGPSLYVERADDPDMTGIDPAKTSPIGN